MAPRSSSVMFFSAIPPTRHPRSPRLHFEHTIKTRHAAVSSKTPERTSAPDEILLLPRSRIGAVRAIRLTTEHLASTQKVNVFPSPPSARRTSYEAHGQRQQRQGSEVFRANIRDMKGCGFCGVRCSKHWVYQLPDAMNSCYHLTVHVDFTL